LLTYRAIVPGLSTAHLRHVARLIHAHRVAMRSRWRRLPPAQQALLVLVHLRCGDPYAHLAASFGVGATTAYRYIGETVDLLAAAAPQLSTTIAARAGREVTILDGTIVSSHRVRWTAEHKRWYCARKKTYGINLQALTDEQGSLLWISTALPGGVHDLTAARHHGVIAAATDHGVHLWADKAYIGEAPTVLTAVKGKDLPDALQRWNRRHAQRRARGERGFATLKSWQILHRVRGDLTQVGAIAQAILVIHHATSTPIRMK
jgi:hypothetical protein